MTEKLNINLEKVFRKESPEELWGAKVIRKLRAAGVETVEVTPIRGMPNHLGVLDEVDEFSEPGAVDEWFEANVSGVEMQIQRGVF